MARKKHEEHENHERWLVSYADFITLLFAFFVVLYATSTQNIEKEKKFEESIRQEMKLTGTGPGFGQTGASPNSGDPPKLSDPIDLLQQKRIGNEELQESIEKLVDKTLNEEERKKTITYIGHDSTGVRVALIASTFFPSGSTKLRLPGLKALDKVAEILKKTTRSVVIEGHTDSDPVLGGQFESNWELASLRATTIVRYLIKIHKIEAKRLSAISFADQRPLVANINEANKAKNRRIELLIVNSD